MIGTQTETRLGQRHAMIHQHTIVSTFLMYIYNVSVKNHRNKTIIYTCMYTGKWKFERKYRNCGTEARLGHRHVMIYKCNIIAMLICHNIDVCVPTLSLFRNPVGVTVDPPDW